jgi:hypothetical protein
LENSLSLRLSILLPKQLCPRTLSTWWSFMIKCQTSMTPFDQNNVWLHAFVLGLAGML